jgi:nucleosome-remodeling factor subunit BPTF
LFYLLFLQESSQTVTSSTQIASSAPMQKIITSTGQIITQQMQGNVISSANLQQLLQQRPGQKILIQQTPGGGVQKLLVASSSSAQQLQQNVGEKRIIIQNAAGQQQQIILNQNNVIQSQQQPQQALIVGGQKIILQNAQSPQLKAITTTTSQGQQIQFQVQEQQPQQQQQIVVQSNGSAIAQQLAQGKIQVMNVNGQQMLVKNVGANQVVVGHVKTTTSAGTPVTPIKQVIQPTLVATTTSPQHQMVKTIQSPTSSASETSDHAALLANHPPGTIIKCVTASVMQTVGGPRIVLQGLQGNEFNPQQTLLVQQQVKQQLMKGINSVNICLRIFIKTLFFFH